MALARTLAIPYKRTEGMRISPADIVADEEKNGRAYQYKKSDLQDLLSDLRNGVGITSPVWVRRIQTEEGQGVELVAGFRRWLAACEYLKECPDYLLPCIIVEPKDDLDALAMNLRENAKRKNLSIIDLGHAAYRLHEEPTKGGGRTLAEVGEILNISQPQVSQVLKLVTELPESLQNMIAAKKVTADFAFTLLKITDRAERQKQIDKLLSGETSEPAQGVPAPKQTRSQRSQSKELREAARAAGEKIARRLPEIKKYLRTAVDEEGPGSNKGEVKLKKKLLQFISGEISEDSLDKWFNELCVKEIY
jgi:ParB/RepB/Spo0J family partition protein